MQAYTALTRRGVLGALAGLAAWPVAAQQRGPRRGQMIERRLETMKERLKLTSDQEDKIRAIFKDESARMREIREKTMESGDRAAMREQMRKLREETDAKILEVLNEDQKAEYKKMQEEMREKMRQRRGGRPPR